jgi:hypothetical protein
LQRSHRSRPTPATKRALINHTLHRAVSFVVGMSPQRRLSS